MSSAWINDLVSLMQQQSIEQTQDIELHLIGHVIEYNPVTHTCRVLLSTRGAENTDGTPQVMETGWCQVGSPVVGNGFGIQYALRGGATAQNPEKGEQVQVSVQHRASGLCAVANLTFNDTMTPPGGGTNGQAGQQSNDNAVNDTTGKLQLFPGELVVMHQSGSFIKFYSNGDIGLSAARDLIANVQNNCQLTVAQGNANVTVSQGDLDVTVSLGNADISVVEGDTIIESVDGSIAVSTVNGDLAIEVETGAVSIFGNANVDINSAVEVDVESPIVNVRSPIVNIGTAAFQQLCNLAFLSAYNAHQHIDSTGGATSSPTTAAVPGVQTTVNLEAS